MSAEMVEPGPKWVKCSTCSKVKIAEVFHVLDPAPVCLKCHQYPATTTAARNSKSATARYRERTAGAYDRAYNKAVRLAMGELRARYPMDWDQLLAEKRKEMGI